MINLMLITNDPTLAAFAVGHGVQRIFVDLEILGKQARQGHKDTLISNHSIEDVKAVRGAVPQGGLLVRVNPLHEGLAAEVDAAIDAGADIIMLPMFSTIEEVQEVVRLIDGRCRFIPLVETAQALDIVEFLVCEPGVDELYVGLNDLHLTMGLDFMFQLLVDGTVESIAQKCLKRGKPFGFGGIARMDEGLLSGRLVLAEHCRIGSTAVILSRTFHRSATNLSEIRASTNFGHEIQQLRAAETTLLRRDNSQVLADRQLLLDGVANVLAHLRRVL